MKNTHKNSKYVYFYPEKLISIEAIVTVHYFEYNSTFEFAGERHNFWELVCVDKGEIEIFNGSEWSTLKRGQIKFHQPNEFHALKANGITSPNVVVISFLCNSPAIDFFRNKTLSYTESEHILLSQIIACANNLFSTPLDDPYLLEMKKKENAPLGESQLLLQNTEMLLLKLYRLHNTNLQTQKQYRISSNARASSENKIIEHTISYFSNNIRQNISSEDICNEVCVSYDLLKNIFSNRFQCGPLKYFTRMKIDEIKTEIRNSAMNITELATHFGYSSIHYFSRQFKKETGMSPTEYATSIKARAKLN